jgi:hypothetical protein
MQFVEHVAGTECAAWFEHRFQELIVGDLKHFLNAYRRVRAQARGAIEDKDQQVDPVLGEWLDETPDQVSHSFEIMAPEAAYPNSKINLIVVVQGDNQYWLIGHYAAHITSEGSMPASWESYAWHPAVENGIPWPVEYDEAEGNQYLPTPTRPHLEETTNFLSTFSEKVNRFAAAFYGTDRRTGIQEQSFPSESGGFIPMGDVGYDYERRPSSGRSRRRRGFSSSRRSREKDIQRHADTVFDEMMEERRSSRRGGSRSRSKTSRRRSGRSRKTFSSRSSRRSSARYGGLASRKASSSRNRSSSRKSRRSTVSAYSKAGSLSDTQIEKVVRTQMTPYRSWWEDLRHTNKKILDQVIDEYCIPIFRSLYNEDPDVTSSEFWHELEIDLVEDGVLLPGCTFKAGKYEHLMDLDRDGYCTVTECHRNPQYGSPDDPFEALVEKGGTGRCKHQVADIDPDFEDDIN